MEQAASQASIFILLPTGSQKPLQLETALEGQQAAGSERPRGRSNSP